MKRTLLVIAALLIGASAFAGGAKQQSNERVVKVGVVGDITDMWTPIAEALKKEGVIIELVKFSEYVLPNRALEDGEIDLNAFQHYAYLNNEISTKGYHISPVGETILAPLGLYFPESKIRFGDKDRGQDRHSQ
ncbi:MetQ/NlpA family ABC transporter substrate-binding protein [Treponema primitia]|uniref:MetQ/NlpA family ABC transporter substrate-binding protein n=1 Tax=Treponema primitia TaxID=88058 RepID=UPI00031906D4|nr:MetQ/NlpA family ABC transporter substrate-binding protein [Treponema primitia]